MAGMALGRPGAALLGPQSLGMRLLACAAILLGPAGCRAPERETVVAVSPGATWPPEPAPSTADAAAAQRVTADTLYTVYSQNLVIGANPHQRFLNRLLLVSGAFHGINRRLPGKTYIELSTHDGSAFVYAELHPDARPLLSTLQPGENLQLLCRGNGVVGGSPLLKSCLPQQLAPSTATLVR